MNNRQKEILQSQLSDEEEVLKKLRGIYKEALDDIDDNIAALLGRTDTENLQSIIYQVDYQKALKSQINGILDKMNSEQFTTVSDYLSQCYESGFLGTMYDLNGQGIPLIMPIDQKQVVQALVNDTKLSKSLYQTFGEDVSLLKKRIQNNISRGIAQGSSYANIARSIASGMVGDYSKMRGGALSRAYTIARTEGHRIQNQAAFDAQKKAKEKGAKVVKQWDATLDGRTRDSHRQVDGELKELDEKFSNGLMFPGDPNGKAAEVVNCRCALLQRARWALDEAELKTLQDRAEYFGLDKTENFEDFKSKYVKVVDNYGNDSYNGNKKSNVVTDAIVSGQVKTQINEDKQKIHMIGGKDYKEGRSYMTGTMEDMQELVDKLSGTGQPIMSSKGWTNKERVVNDKPVGVHVDIETNEKTETNNAMIIYSKTGTHIMPRKGE